MMWRSFYSTCITLELHRHAWCVCVRVTRLRCVTHCSDQSLYQHQAVAALLLVRDW